MSTTLSEYKKRRICAEIVSAALVYRNHFAGKTFLYIYAGSAIEISFPISAFRHLTGVATSLNANKFYENARKSTLSPNQIFFDNTHPLALAKKKLSKFADLPQLTSQQVCIVADMSTSTYLYKIGLTDLDLTLGLTDNFDPNGNKVNNCLIPRTLRIKDKAIENSRGGDFVDFILSKSAADTNYDTVGFEDRSKAFPESFMKFLSPALAQHFNL